MRKITTMISSLRREVNTLLAFTLVFLLTGMSLFPAQRAFAAGSAVVSVEKSSSSVTKGKNVELRLYVTNSGADITGVEFNVVMSKIAAASTYSPSNTYFNGTNVAISGNSVGSTNMKIVAGAFTGLSPGKKLIGRIIVTGKTVGTASVTISNLQASDDNFEAMTVSGNGTTLTVKAPPTTSQPSTSDDDTPTTSTDNNNAVTNPNPDGTAVVPDSSNENPGSKVVPEQELTDAYNQTNDEDSQSTNNNTIKNIANNNAVRYGAAGALVFLAAGAVIGAQMIRKRRRKTLAHFDFANKAVTQDTPQTNPQVPSSNPEAPKPESNDPTIIKPRQ